MQYRFEELKSLRKLQFSNFQKMSKASGLARDTIGNIEKGYPDIQVKKLEHYCQTLGVNYKDYILAVDAKGRYSVLRSQIPNKIDFRPMISPSCEHSTWLSSPVAVTLIPLSVQVLASCEQPITVRRATLRSPQLTNTKSFGLVDIDSTPLTFQWFRWVTLDNARNTDSVPGLLRDSAWRGEIEHRNGGASINAFKLEPGEVESHSVMFQCSAAMTWQTFVSKLPIFGETGISFTLDVSYTDNNGTTGLEKRQFQILPKCFRAVIERSKSLKLPFGSVSRVHPPTLEGENESCYNDCCPDGLRSCNDV